MGQTIAQKIIKEHLISGEMEPGKEVALRIDQTLTQDATGTMAYLEFETMGIPRVKTELSVAYIDHNTLQSGFENADDHRFIQSMAKKYGLYFSRPGNGICHQVHLERFGKPGKTLIGSDSHTPTGGGIGMLAMGAGGLDVAVAMGGGAYYITMPKMYKVNLTGKLRDFVTAKDVSLEILRILSVKGGVGAIIEWGGPGIKTLSVPERATITNMGTELGATTSIFPSDEVTKAFLEAEGRGQDYVELKSDPDAVYDRVIDIDLSTLKPLIACPHSPDNVVSVESLKGTRVDQVCIGSCTNSSLYDMLKVAALLKGKTIRPEVSLSISPGSKQVLTMLADCGALSDILASGASPLVPNIPGIEQDHVYLANDILRFRTLLQNQSIVVLGAGLVGLETAQVLAGFGNQVTVVDLLKQPAPQAPARPRENLLSHLKELHVTLLMGRKITCIHEDGISCEKDGAVERLGTFNSVVVALGSRPERVFDEETLKDPRIHLIGDALEAADAKKGIYEATKLALSL